MPTAGKLAAAVLFAALAWAASTLMKPYFPEGSDLGRFAEINAALGLVLGWRIAGSRAGTGWVASVGYGLTATAAIVVSCAFLQCFAIMIRQSLRKLYDGPVEAVADVFQLMAANSRYLLHPDVVVTLVIGALVCGLVTEWFGRNFA